MMRIWKKYGRDMGEIWERLDLGTKLGIWCFVTYALLYVVLDILEELLGVAF